MSRRWRDCRWVVALVFYSFDHRAEKALTSRKRRAAWTRDGAFVRTGGMIVVHFCVIRRPDGRKPGFVPIAGDMFP